MSTNFHYFHPSDNVAPNATVTTGSTEDPAYPLTNVTDLAYKNLANPGKLAALTGDFIFAWSSAQRVDAVLLWHNFDASLAYAIQMNATNSWGAPTLNLTGLTAPSKRADSHTVKIYKDLRSVSGYSTSGFQYLRINVSGTNSVNLGLKVLLFSGIRQTTRNIQWGFTIEEAQTNIEMETDAHHPWTFDLSAPPRLLSADIRSNNADAELIREWHRACGGGARITCLVPSPTTPDPFLARFKNSLDLSSPGIALSRLATTLKFTTDNPQHITLKEIISGDPEWT